MPPIRRKVPPIRRKILSSEYVSGRASISNVEASSGKTLEFKDSSEQPGGEELFISNFSLVLGFTNSEPPAISSASDQHPSCSVLLLSCCTLVLRPTPPVPRILSIRGVAGGTAANRLEHLTSFPYQRFPTSYEAAGRWHAF